MTRYNLAISFFLKDMVKKSHPIEFDKELKTWFLEIDDELPEDLEKYREMFVDISYEERNEYKAQFNSLRWDRNEKSWKCSKEDFEKIDTYRQNKI